MFGERGAAVVFGDDFARRFQAKGIFVGGDADGFLPGGGAWNGSYFPADGFPLLTVGAVAVECPGQGVRYFMQDSVPDFMRGFQIGADKVDGKGDGFFL